MVLKVRCNGFSDDALVFIANHLYKVCKTSKHLVGWGDIRAAMDPTIVLGKIGVQTMEFTTGWEHFKYLYQEHFGKDVGVSRTTLRITL